MVRLFDTYTPRFRWEHTPEELQQWLELLGLTDIAKTEERVWGFGMAARKPAVTGSPVGAGSDVASGTRAGVRPSA